MTERFASLTARLVAPKPTGVLVTFRVALGVLVTVSAIRFLVYGWVDELFVKPSFFFTYWGFGWVKPLPAAWMHALFVGVALLGACFAAGLFYRVVAIALFFAFAYVQLLDVTNWLNHYYLVSLLLLLSSVMPLGRAGSLDVLLRPHTRLDAFPAWCTYLLRFQVGVVYVYAGLAKATSDWLVHAQPLNIWLSARTNMLGALTSTFDERWAAYAFSWAGFLFDTFIVAFLLWKRTQRWAYAVVLAFHAMTWLLFPIGMFPFIMCASALVFLDPASLLSSRKRARARARARLSSPSPSPAPSPRLHPAHLALASLFCLLQLLAPLRHRLYGGNVLWHEQGMRFSWKVMVREKNGSITYVVESAKAARTWYVSPHRYLTDRQERELSTQPDLVLQLAHRVRDDFRAQGHDDVTVRVEAIVSLNGRSATPMIDPSVDLAHIDDGLSKASWILPEPQGPPIHLRSVWSSGRLASRSGS
ncbi:MAG: Vitamin K-dependent gamma-carboxylase [Labilithrix sp.]|nr:Vitamin K-dependent gamma-carboxylase [Labilithrix sp.]